MWNVTIKVEKEVKRVFKSCMDREEEGASSLRVEIPSDIFSMVIYYLALNHQIRVVGASIDAEALAPWPTPTTRVTLTWD